MESRFSANNSIHAFRYFVWCKQKPTKLTIRSRYPSTRTGLFGEFDLHQQPKWSTRRYRNDDKRWHIDDVTAALRIYERKPSMEAPEDCASVSDQFRICLSVTAISKSTFAKSNVRNA